MSRSFAGEMKRHCQRGPETSNRSTCTSPFPRCNTALPPPRHSSPPSSQKQWPAGQAMAMGLPFAGKPRMPCWILACRVECSVRTPLLRCAHAGDEVKGVSLNSHAPHAVPSDCSFLLTCRCQLLCRRSCPAASLVCGLALAAAQQQLLQAAVDNLTWQAASFASLTPEQSIGLRSDGDGCLCVPEVSEALKPLLLVQRG